MLPSERDKTTLFWAAVLNVLLTLFFRAMDQPLDATFTAAAAVICVLLWFGKRVSE
jgi:hypothetical protein